MQKKLVFVIDSDLYIRNYFETGFINKLSKIYKIYFIYSKDVKNKNFIKKNNKNFLGFYSISNFKKRIYYLFNNVLIWKFRKKSSSFIFRFYRLLNFENFPIKINRFQSKFSFKNFLIKTYTKFFSINFFFEILKKILNSQILLNKSVTKYLKKLKPDLVIYPTNAFEPLVSEIPIICKKLDIKSYFLIDNWDNLSSKSILINHPDYISVWGKQTANHARKIQNIPKKSIFVCGTPRYETFFKKKDSKLKKIYNKNYILFLGTSLKFDEEIIVEKIDGILQKNKKYFGNCYLVYRPHPWRQSYDLINDKDLKKTIIDKQVKKNYLNLNFKTTFQPNLNYYPSLLSNAEFVLGGLTSMMIESLIFKKKYLALTFNDNKNYTNQYVVSKYFSHFKEIKKFKNITFLSKISNNLLEKELKKIWKKRKTINPNLDKDLKYIIDNGESGYFSKIKNSLNYIFSHEKN